MYLHHYVKNCKPHGCGQKFILLTLYLSLEVNPKTKLLQSILIPVLYITLKKCIVFAIDALVGHLNNQKKKASNKFPMGEGNSDIWLEDTLYPPSHSVF